MPFNIGCINRGCELNNEDFCINPYCRECVKKLFDENKILQISNTDLKGEISDLKEMNDKLEDDIENLSIQIEKLKNA